jgi:Cu/Ag efflux pump CusA
MLRNTSGVARVVSRTDGDEVTGTGGRFAIFVRLTAEGSNDRPATIRTIRNLARELPEALILLRAIEPDPAWPFRTADDEQIAVITSAAGDLAGMKAGAEGLIKELELIPGIQDVTMVSARTSLDLSIKIDLERCAAFGVIPDEVQRLFDTTFLGLPVGPLLSMPLEDGGAVEVAVQEPRNARAYINERLENAVLLKDNRRLPLRTLGEIRTTIGPATILRQDGQRVIAVRFAVRGIDAPKALADARKATEARMGKSYRVDWGR